MGKFKLGININDWWIGYFRGGNYHYVCILPCIVISWARKGVAR